MAKEKVLEVNDLKVSFKTDNGIVRAVRGVSFDLSKGETLCIVGESGSGKSVTSKAIMGILSNNAIIEDGSIIYQGENLLEVSEEEFHKIRGHKIGMIFQDPLSSLNPIVRIGKQITEATLVNANKLKKMYESIISHELTQYKNILSKLNINIEKSAHLMEQEISANKKIIANKKATPEEKAAAKEAILKAKANHKELVAKYKAETKEKLAVAKPALVAKKKEARAQVAEYKAEVNARYAKNIKPIREKLANEHEGFINRFVPITALYFKNKLFNFVNTCKVTFSLNKGPKYEAFVAKHDEVVKHYGEILARRNEILAELNAVKNERINALRITKLEAKRRALEIMREVGIPLPEKRFRQYPFEFSGGMRQRIVIAIALTATPEILICDEPTTALDVTIQAQILELIKKIQAERNIACIFITHDLGVVANMADRVAVMYAGKIVEYGTAEEIFFEPKHPYTWALLASIPDIDSKERLDAIPGTPPNMIYPPKGDAFALRSKYAMQIDFEEEPPYFKVSDTHYAATWLLHPNAPKVEMPKIVSERIRIALENAKKSVKEDTANE